MKQNILYLAMLWFASSVYAGNALEAGKTYSITLADNLGKSLFVKNSLPDNMAQIVLWTETNVPAQQWSTERDAQGRYAFKNVYTGKYLNYANGAVSQYSGKSWWTLEPADEDSITWYLKKSTNSGLRVDKTDDGSVPKMGVAQAWKMYEVEPQTEFNEAIRQCMANGFLLQYMQDKGTGYRTFVNGGWSESETQEAILDMYEATGERHYLNIYEACYNYFKYHVGNTWTSGTVVGGYGWYGYSFNDDVMWQIIGAARASLLTGKQTYVDDAKRNFDLIWNRAYLGYVGLLRWAEQDGDRNSANSCVNGPAEIAACYIGMCTGDETYFEKARLLYENQRKYLTDMSTGQVYDSAIFDPATAEVKQRNTWASTYNQGTMLGAAVLLYQHYGEAKYRSDADKIINYSRTNMCDASGIIRVCQNANGDFQGFKGILMRYAGLYVRTFGVSRYDTWLKDNAMRAYCNMNSHAFGHSAWLTKANEDFMFGDVNYSGQAFGASTALSAAFGTPINLTGSKETAKIEQTTENANTISLMIHASQAGHYRLNVYYKCSNQQTVSLAVNDAEVLNRTYCNTGGYSSMRPYFITLHGGNNTILLTCGSNANMPTVTKVEVLYLAPTSNSLEAEYTITHGQTNIVKDVNASGSQLVGNIGGGSNNYITFYYNADEASDYDLDITYCSAASRSMYVRLNNGQKKMIQFENTGGNTAETARTKTTRVHLNTGMNTISLGNDSGWAPNVDKIELRKVEEETGITELRHNVTADDVYNLQGVKIKRPIATDKSIYIVGNKKTRF